MRSRPTERARAAVAQCGGSTVPRGSQRRHRATQFAAQRRATQFRSSGSTVPAVRGGSTVPAVRGGSTVPAVRGGSTVPAVRGGSTVPAVRGGSMVPPQLSARRQHQGSASAAFAIGGRYSACYWGHLPGACCLRSSEQACGAPSILGDGDTFSRPRFRASGLGRGASAPVWPAPRGFRVDMAPWVLVYCRAGALWARAALRRCRLPRTRLLRRADSSRCSVPAEFARGAGLCGSRPSAVAHPSRSSPAACGVPGGRDDPGAATTAHRASPTPG
ncbi:hypothetical protein EV648_10274 [Kribbella sp. VKM Ac-2568]|nr:hypothetical protein EV648_10274 [Kribbella sp. VKM Ac-2568]